MYAVSGGPVYTSGISPVGTFSGVIEGITETDDTTSSAPPIPGDPLPSPSGGATTPSNALGLFNLSVPAVGSAAGAFVLFADGIVFSGTIQAFADPNNDRLIGILQATTTIMITEDTAAGTTATTTVTESSVGEINARVTGATSSSGGLGNLVGTANLEISFGEIDVNTLEPIVNRTITFNVLGVEQSGAATATTSTGTGTGATSAPVTSAGG